LVGLARCLTISALVFVTFLINLEPLLAEPDPPSHPVLFVHGWCGSAYDWEPLLDYLGTSAPKNMYPNKSVYTLAYHKDTDSYTYSQIRDSDGKPLLFLGAEPPDLPYQATYAGVGHPEIMTIDANVRYFVIKLYDPDTHGYDPQDITKISILNKAYEVKKVIALIKTITNVNSVNIVGHSMGGLDARAYAENMGSAGECYNKSGMYGSYPFYFGLCARNWKIDHLAGILRFSEFGYTHSHEGE
jgi:pimeloyl-ACP methyl ester carboxylesterase